MSKFTRKSAATPVAAIFAALTGRSLMQDDEIMIDLADVEGYMLPHGTMGDVVDAPEEELMSHFAVFSNPDGSICVLPHPRALEAAHNDDPMEQYVAVSGLEDDDMPLIRNNPARITLLAPRC